MEAVAEAVVNGVSSVPKSVGAQNTASRKRNFFLTPHALDRVLSRSLRSPTWLLEALSEKRYAHLQYGKLTRRRYALLFDPIGETYFVAILALDKPAVITVLTLVQYENREGVVPQTLLQLAKMAYVNSVTQPEQKSEPQHQRAAVKATQGAPIGYPEIDVLLAAGDDGAWNARWRVVVKIKRGFASKNVLKIRIENQTRHPWIAAMLAEEKSPTTQSLQPVPPFSLERQARLLARSHEFHLWLAREINFHNHLLEDVTDVEIRSSQPTNAIVKVRDIILRSLAES